MKTLIKQKNFLSSDIYHKLISLVIPITLQQFMLSLVSVCDATMLGTIDQNLLSAASLASQVTFVYTLFLAAMTAGTSIFAAQFYGKGDLDAVEQVLGFVLRITLVISTCFFLAALLIPDTLMYIYTSDEVLIDAGSRYLRIIGISYMFCSISQIYLAIMKNSQKAFQSMLISFVTVIINIILNAILILGLFGIPRLGIEGAAIATVVARVLELVLAMRENFKKDVIKIRVKYVITKNEYLSKHYWKYVLPVLGNNLVWGLGINMYSVIMGHMGTDAVAANSVATIIKNLFACMCVGLANGSGIIIGNELGVDRFEKAKKYGRELCIVAIVCGIIAGIVMIACIPIISAFMNLTDVANNYFKWMIVMSSYYMIGKAINSTTIAGIFSAGGDSKFGLICDTITLWCVTVPLGLIAAFVLKLPVLAVYFVMNLDEIIKLPAVYKNYIKYKWLRNLTIKEEENES